MPPLKLPYLKCEIVKGQHYCWYRRDGRRIARLAAKHGDPEWLNSYQQIHARAEAAAGKPGIELLRAGALGHVIREYKQSKDFKTLAPKTQKDYARLLTKIDKKFGHEVIGGLTRRVALTWLDKLSDRPATHNYTLGVLQKLFSFAHDRGHIPINPILNIKRLKTRRRPPWPPHEIEKFMAVSSAPMREAMLAGLYIGQRTGDIIRVQKPARDGCVNVMPQKTERSTGIELWIPLASPLAAALKARPTAATTLLTDAAGLPWTRRKFERAFAEAKAVAGVPKEYVFHGLRKNASIMLLEAGCTKDQAKAITGHSTDEMVNFYAEQIDRKKMAIAAIAKLDGGKK